MAPGSFVPKGWDQDGRNHTSDGSQGPQLLQQCILQVTVLWEGLTSSSRFDPNSEQGYFGWILPNIPLAACSVLSLLFSSCAEHLR